MGDAAGDRADGLQPLRLLQSLLDAALLGHIGDDARYAGRRAVLGVVNTTVDDDRPKASIRPADPALEAKRATRHRHVETAPHAVPILSDHSGEQCLAAPLGWRTSIAKDVVMARRSTRDPGDQVGVPHAHPGRVERNGEAFAGILRFRSQLGLP